MYKIFLGLFLAFFASMFSGCVSFNDGVGSATCAEAIALYNGRISEAEWLEKLDAESQGVPAKGFFAVELSDGFLFYAVENENGIPMVYDVVVPANGDENLKAIAKSMRRNVPVDMEFVVGEKTIVANGETFSDAQFLVFLKDNNAASHSKKHRVFVNIENGVSGARVLQIQELLQSLGLSESVPVKVAMPDSAAAAAGK